MRHLQVLDVEQGINEVGKSVGLVGWRDLAPVAIVVAV